MREPIGPAEPPISTVPNALAGSLAQLLQPWTDALNDLSSSAKQNLQMCNQSLTTFQNHGKALIGDTTLSFQGLGAKAFANLSTLNEGHSMLINAKIHDFYNASSNLLSEIQGLTSQYEVGNGRYENDGGGGFPNPTIYQFVGNMTYDDILHTLMDGFLTTTAVDSLMDPSTIQGSVHSGVQVGLNKMISKINTSYQTNPLKQELTQHPDELNKDNGYWKGRLDQLTQEYHTSIQIVQGLAKNMETQLDAWAFGLYELAKQYAQEVTDAAQINRPTVSDFIYESSQPTFANAPVLIWQLPNGGLYIMVKGGDAGKDEQLIKDYLAQYGQDGKAPPVTIMGYQDGAPVAQQIINDAQFTGGNQNPNGILSINIINAVMVGNQDQMPKNQTPDVNYVDYYVTPEEKKAWSFLGLNEEQAVTMGVTTVVALALDQPELLEGDVVAVFGKLGAEKLVEYATALGFNAADSGDPQAAAQYLIQWANDHNQDIITVNGQQIPMRTYVQQQLISGNLKTLPQGGPKTNIQYAYDVPDVKDFNNSSYLGEQFVLDPVGMSQLNNGAVTVPAIPNFPAGN